MTLRADRFGVDAAPRGPARTRVAIVGGGPVGLYLACALRARGIDCRVFERSATPRQHSRSIGVHPVSLELLAQLGVAEPLIEQGVQVQRGLALKRLGEPIGTLDFGHLPPPFPFVLSVPQYRTEAVLEAALAARDDAALCRGRELVGLQDLGDRVRLTLRRVDALDAADEQIDADWVVGADGVRSATRELVGLPYDGGPYPDTFVMGDFVDDTDLGPQAAIFLHHTGLIESFPLPDGLRRWVARSGADGLAAPAAGDALADAGAIRARLVQIVRERIDHDLGRTPCLMQSTFGVQHFLARRFVDHRVVLAGDAAHVVSPIGGQGMNLGWKDAARLLEAFDAIERGEPWRAALQTYDRRSRRVARVATRRSAFYMRLGRAQRFPAPRDAAIGLLLRSPLARVAARLFTMRGLETVPI
jgi:2-polyprenyl-6-methoxyphenol hydroxylase-like FAD-dependent oxidoreductase